MELKDFVTHTLLAILEGVEGAQSAATEMGGAVAPSKNVGIQTSKWARLQQVVKFDVEVAVSEGSGTSAGGGIVIGMFGLSGKKDAEQSAHSRNRIKFSIPITLPDGRDGQPTDHKRRPRSQ